MEITVYKHLESGDVATIEDWKNDFEGMDVESWFGLEKENCNADDWIEGGKLEKIILTIDDEVYPTCRLFDNCFSNANNGEKYNAEYACDAVYDDDDGEQEEYKIYWQFEEIKGEEREIDQYDWESTKNIYKICRQD